MLFSSALLSDPLRHLPRAGHETALASLVAVQDSGISPGGDVFVLLRKGEAVVCRVGTHGA
jgi:hypothetical protein